MNSNEALRIKSCLELTNCLPEHKRPATYVKTSIIISCLNPFNVLSRNEYSFRAVRDEKSLRKGIRARGADLHMLEKIIELSLDAQCRLCRDALSDLCDSSLEPLRTDRLNKVIQCMHLERLDCKCVVGGDKYS